VRRCDNLLAMVAQQDRQTIGAKHGQHQPWAIGHRSVCLWLIDRTGSLVRQRLIPQRVHPRTVHLL
jgi:hypothetical protein